MKIKRIDGTSEAQKAKVDAFLQAYVGLCREHGLYFMRSVYDETMIWSLDCDDPLLGLDPFDDCSKETAARNSWKQRGGKR